MKKIILLCILLIAALALVLAPRVAEHLADSANPVTPQPGAEASAESIALHNSLQIVDWHSDSLMWQRSILERANHSHVDLPRLQEGNVAIQMFTVVSKVPYGQNVKETKDGFDMITPVTIAQHWPSRTWTSLLQRALYQGEKLQQAVDDSAGALHWIKNRSDLQALLTQRSGGDGQPPVGALFGAEGAQILEGDIDNLSRLYNSGLRMLGLTHFFDNRLGGSLHGISKAGLSEFGQQVVVQAQRKNIIIDLAHASEAMVADVLAISTRPMVVSHTGVKGACDSPRNINDQLMKQIADQGGLVAMGYWNAAICDRSPAGIAKAIKYAVQLLGEDHVALGSDFDGGVHTSIDTAQLAQLTHALVEAGLSKSQISKVMGGNSIAFLQQNLPAN